MGEQNYASKCVLVSAVLDASGANAVIVGPPGYPMEVQQFRVMVGIAQTVATATITVTKRITTGSASGALTLGTFALAVGNSLGDEFLIDVHHITNINLNAGEQLVFTSDGGGDAGSYYIGVIGNYVNPGPNPAKAFVETSRKGFENGTGTYNYLAFTAA